MSLRIKITLFFALLIVGAMSYFYINPISLDDDTNFIFVDPQDDFPAFMEKSQQQLTELNAESDSLVEEDKYTDLTLKERDADAGFTEEEFNKTYPEMNMNGIYVE